MRDWTPQGLLEVSGSYWQGCALQAAVRLDIFSQISDASLSAAALADLLDCDRRAMAMLLRALTAMGLLNKDQVGYHCPQPLCYWLDKSSSQYLGHMIGHHQHLVASWNLLDQAVISGKPQRSHAQDEEAWREDFLLGMHNLSNLLAPQVVAKIDLGPVERLLDVGGGPGTWAINFCRQYPELRARVFDLPTTEPYATQNILRSGMEERILFQAGDYHLDPLGSGYDLVWLSHVLHAEGPTDAQQLVRNAAAALTPGGQLLIHEFILGDQEEGPVFPALFSLNMLLATDSGQAYTQSELIRMCDTAGLVEVQRLELPPGLSSGVIRARRTGP